jgi:hypothetical protein
LPVSGKNRHDLKAGARRAGIVISAGEGAGSVRMLWTGIFQQKILSALWKTADHFDLDRYYRRLLVKTKFFILKYTP